MKNVQIREISMLDSIIEDEFMVDKHTNTHTETKSKYFDGHCCPSQSEESECM